MDVYCTSRSTSSSEISEKSRLVYIGTSLNKAIEAVNPFTHYEKLFPGGYLPSALPKGIKKEVIKYYPTNGWWFSIVKIQLIEKE